MSQSVFRWAHRVSYAECTLGNHVYHARYLDILERARGEFFRQAGHPLLGLQEGGVILPVIECRLRHQAAARYDDALVVEVRVTELARVRVAFGYRILNAEGRLILEAETVHACTCVEGKVRRLPAELRAALAPLLRPGRQGGGDSFSN